MTLIKAINHAREDAAKSALPMAVVCEGLHADEFAERDEDGESYGYCPVLSVPILYRYGRIVEVIKSHDL